MKIIEAFVLYSNYAECIGIPLFQLLKEKGFEPNVMIIDDLRKFKKIPENNNIYFIHMNDLEKDEKKGLEKLQEQQPESYFVILKTGEGGLFKGKERIFGSETHLIYEQEIDMILSKYIKNMK